MFLLETALHLSFLLFAGPIYINFRLMLLVPTTHTDHFSPQRAHEFCLFKQTYFKTVCYLNSLTLLYIQCRYIDRPKPQRKHKLHIEIDKIKSTSMSNKNNQKPIANTQNIIVDQNDLFTKYNKSIVVYSLSTTKHGSVPGF